ncbi:MAG: hypothetical protein ACI9OJ_000452 [Myxococcota bacterium]|jgi:hypothetical protein
MQSQLPFRLRVSRIIAVVLSLMLLPVSASAARGPATVGVVLTLEPGESEPKEGRSAPAPDALAALAAAASKAPRDRSAQFAWIRGLMAGGQLESALTAARAWRERDAYNLVVVRLMGDLLVELGRPIEARRVYSAVVELLPDEPSAHRALATVLKQAGDLPGAYARLETAARLRPEDARIQFELADVAHRLERFDEAAKRFGAIIDHDGTAEQIRYPAKQRLAQILSAKRLEAERTGNSDAAAVIASQITELSVKGGANNDIKVYLTWDTDGSDIDLWVTNPVGERVSYKKKKGRFGGSLYDDVTTGYGPESFTARTAAPGTYLVQVNFYGTNRRAFAEARGEVIVVLNEGRATEHRTVLPYRLFKTKQTVSVARIRVSEDN